MCLNLLDRSQFRCLFETRTEQNITSRRIFRAASLLHSGPSSFNTMCASERNRGRRGVLQIEAREYCPPISWDAFEGGIQRQETGCARRTDRLIFSHGRLVGRNIGRFSGMNACTREKEEANCNDRTENNVFVRARERVDPVPQRLKPAVFRALPQG